MPVVGIDYFFITAEGVKRRKELSHELTPAGDAVIEQERKKGTIVKCLVVRCMATKCLFAHVVPCKGQDEDDFVANLVASDVLWLGHLELMLKADNEPALQAMVEEGYGDCAREGSGRRE